MKKETKRLITGIVMLLGCAVCGHANAAAPILYGIDATNRNVNGNEQYPDGKIENVDRGIHAKSDSSDRYQASYTLKNIDINASKQNGIQYGAYAEKNGDIFLGNDDTESIAISAKHMNGSSYGLYSYASASAGKATISVKGKQISVITNATGATNGIYTSGNSSINVGTETAEIISIETKGEGDTRAINNKANVTILGEKIRIAGVSETLAYGVYTQGNTIIGTDSTEEMTIKAEGKTRVYGISTYNGSQNATFRGKKFQLDVIGSNATVKGVETSSDTKIIADDAVFDIKGKSGTGIDFSSAKGQVDIQVKNQLHMNVKSDGMASAISGSSGTARVSADFLNILAVGKNANIINTGTNATVELGKNANVINLEVQGTENAYGINSIKPSTIKLGENAKKVNIISSAGEIAHGISVSDGTNVTVGGKDSEIYIKTDAEKQSVGILTTRNNESMTGSATTNINGKLLSIDAVSTNDSRGIHVQNSSTTATDNRATVNVNTENTDITAKTALSVFSQGVLNVNSNLVTHGENAIMTRGDADVNINTDGKHTTKLNGNIVFDYGGTTGVDSNVNVNLTGKDSSWTGNAKVNWESSDPSTAPSDELKQVNNMNLTVADGAQWNPTSVEEYTTGTKGAQAVALNSLNLNNGVVNLDDKNLSEDFVVNVDKISGSGTINTNNLQNMMFVQNKTDGTKLIVHGTGAIADEILADQTGEKMKLLAATVVTGDEDNEKAASDVITTDAGIISGALYADVDSNGNIIENSIKRAVNTSNQAISNMATLSLMTWRQENNDMNKRLGELRASQGEQGVWARMARGQAKYGAQGIKNQYNYYQLGYDSKISDTWTLGGAFTYTDGESSYTNGSGTNKHTGFAIYGSNLRDDGSFIDIIAKYAHMKNDFDVNGGIGKGDYSTNGYSLSAEYGKRFQQDGFWIEPQAELTYGKVSSADFKTANGASVHQDSMDSLVGRLGFSLGKDLSRGNVYVRASYLYDFQGDTAIAMMKDGAATSFRTDLGGSWWEFGVGTNLNLGHDTHFYLDVETTAGGDVDTPWQWNAGVRFSF